MPAPLPNAPIVSSAANGLSVRLAFNGKTTAFGPVAAVRGSADPAYDHTAHLDGLDHTLSLEPGSALNPTLHIQASVIDTAAAGGMGVDAISADGAADVGSANFVLTDNPRVVLGVLGLSISASHVHASATYSHVYGMNKSFTTGDASFGSLNLGGALIGKSLTFSGDAAPNTVLYSSPTVTVTLDRQTVSDLIPTGTGSNKTPTPAGIATQAIDISLHNAPLFGGKVSGDIIIGQAWAGLHAKGWIPAFTGMTA